MKTKQSYDYWRKRQDERLAYSEKISNQTVANIADVYDDSLKRVESRIENILDNYSKSIKMPKDQLKELLSQHDKETLLRELQDDLIKNGANTNENMKWLRGNYLSRLNNQESIKLQLENERRIIAENEKAISTLGYKKTIDQTYKSMAKDLTGKSRSLNESAKDSMLNKRWVADRNYSQRVWNNTGKLSNEIDKVINSSLLSGAPKHEIINELSERYDVARYRAEALVRTEMNYFENQTELKSYEDLGVTHYTYLAVRDNRTSSICSELDGTRHSVKDAKPGFNYPPMHTNCRAGTVPDLEFEDDYRVYKNPITREREKTTKSYEEWLKGVEDAAETKYNIDRDKILDKRNDNHKYLDKNKMNLTDILEKLSKSEIDAINRYSGAEYKYFNKYSREGIKGAPDEYKEVLGTLQKALHRTELLEDTVLYRGTSGVSLNIMNMNELGETSLKGFTSTTIDRNVSKSFMDYGKTNKVFLELIAPKGTKGLFIKSISKIKGEEEFLMPDNTKIEIVYIKKKGDYTHVKARVVL